MKFSIREFLTSLGSPDPTELGSVGDMILH